MISPAHVTGFNQYPVGENEADYPEQIEKNNEQKCIVIHGMPFGISIPPKIV
jgi:hypothetical protein